MLVSGLTVAALGLFGAWFAWLQYRRPITPAYVAVVFGVAVTVVGQVALTLSLLGLGLGAWGVVAGILTPFALTGIPMAVAQERKLRRMRSRANRRRCDTGPLDGDHGDA